MSIAPTVTNCLRQRGVPIDVVDHPHSHSSLQSAMSARINSDRVAKGVVLKDRRGYLLAVLPANRDLSLREFEEHTGRHMRLATEYEVGELFRDCEIGAIPAFGPAYGLETIVDDELCRHSEVFVEAGDHERLLRVAEPDFEACMSGARFEHIDTQPH